MKDIIEKGTYEWYYNNKHGDILHLKVDPKMLKERKAFLKKFKKTIKIKRDELVFKVLPNNKLKLILVKYKFNGKLFDCKNGIHSRELSEEIYKKYPGGFESKLK